MRCDCGDCWHCLKGQRDLLETELAALRGRLALVDKTWDDNVKALDRDETVRQFREMAEAATTMWNNAERELAALRRLYELCDENEKRAIDRNAELGRELATARELLAQWLEYEKWPDFVSAPGADTRAFLAAHEERTNGTR